MTRFLLAMLLGAAAAGCRTPTTPSLTSAQVSGTWRLISIQVTNSSTVPVPETATYNMTLADGRVSVTADCNVCTSTFTLSGASLTIGPNLACTRASCPTFQYENAYETLLSGESIAQINGNTLTLTSARGRLTFSR